MKIVVKHVDILRGEMKDTQINEYLVYLYDEHEQAKEAHICYGEANLDDYVNSLLWGHKTMSIMSDTEETDLPIETISYNEFKELNKVEDGE